MIKHVSAIMFNELQRNIRKNMTTIIKVLLKIYFSMVLEIEFYFMDKLHINYYNRNLKKNNSKNVLSFLIYLKKMSLMIKIKTNKTIKKIF